MTISRDKYEEIKYAYSGLLTFDEDAENALIFAHDLLLAEIEAMEEKCPYATDTINRYQQAAYDIFALSQDISNEEYDQV